jgi:uncharacterized protein YukE
VGEIDERRKLEHAVVVAAREERAAQAALVNGIGPTHPRWCRAEEEGYQARLARWQEASRALVQALERLGRLATEDRPRDVAGSV